MKLVHQSDDIPAVSEGLDALLTFIVEGGEDNKADLLAKDKRLSHKAALSLAAPQNSN